MKPKPVLFEAPCGLHLYPVRVIRCRVCCEVRERNLEEATKAGAAAGRVRTPGKFQPSAPDDASGVRRAAQRKP